MTGTGAIVVVALLLLLAGLVTINVLKGKRWFAVIGLIAHVAWVVGAIRLAKPDSWWARRFYDADKLHRSRVRFGLIQAPPPQPPEASWPIAPAESAPECSGSGRRSHAPIRCTPVQDPDEWTYRCPTCGRERRVPKSALQPA